MDASPITLSEILKIQTRKANIRVSAKKRWLFQNLRQFVQIIRTNIIQPQALERLIS